MKELIFPSSAPPPPSREGRGWLGWTGLAMAMVVLAVILAFGGHHFYVRYRAYRAQTVADEATALLRQERWEAASQLLHEAFKNYGQTPPVMRALSELCLDGYDDPLMAANLLRQVLASGQGTPADLRRLAEAMLKQGDAPEARRLYDALPAAERSNRPGLELLSDIERRGGQVTQADATRRQALAQEPDEPRSRLRLALMDEASAFEVSKSVAAEAIWTLARRDDAVAVQAIEHLCDSPSLTASQVQELLDLVTHNGKATERDYFRVLSTYLHLRPLERDKVIAAELQKHEGKKPEALFDFLRWLGIEKQYDRIIALVPVSAALHDPDVFLVYVDALAAAERWKELETLAKTPKAPATAATLHFVHAECLMHLKPDPVAAWAEIEGVYGSATPGEQQLVLRTATLCEATGLNQLALTGYARVAEARPNLRINLLEKIAEIQGRDKNVAGLFVTLKRLHELRPANRTYVDRLNYLRLVTGEELELACDALLGLEKPAPLAQDTSGVSQILLRALAAYRLGETQRMVEEIKSLPASTLLPAGQRAVLAGMRAASGDEVGAYQLGESIHRAVLLDDERRFLSRTGG